MNGHALGGRPLDIAGKCNADGRPFEPRSDRIVLLHQRVDHRLTQQRPLVDVQLAVVVYVKFTSQEEVVATHLRPPTASLSTACTPLEQLLSTACKHSEQMIVLYVRSNYPDEPCAHRPVAIDIEALMGKHSFRSGMQHFPLGIRSTN